MRVCWVLAVLEIACGRVGFTALGDGGSADGPDAGPDAEPSPAPMICNMTNAVAGPVPMADVDLSFIATDTGYTAFWNDIPPPSSVLMGINLTPQVVPDVITTATPVTAIGFNYEASSAMWLDDALLVAPTLAPPMGQATYIKIMARDLAGYSEWGPSPGSCVEPPYVIREGLRYFVLIAPTGIEVRELDAAWMPTGPISTFAIAGATSAAATSELVVASSANTCAFYRPRDNIGDMKPLACTNPRIVTAPDAKVHVVFERGGMLHYASGSPTTMRPDLSNAITTGTSPRLVYAGSKLWLAYIDAGRLWLGNGPPVSERLDLGPAPMPHAFDLSVGLDGNVRLAIVNGSGLTVHEACP